MKPKKYGRRVTCKFLKGKRCGLFDDLISVLKSIQKALAVKGEANECGAGKNNIGSSNF